MSTWRCLVRLPRAARMDYKKLTMRWTVLPTRGAVTDYNDLQPWWKVNLAYPIWVSQVEIKGHPCE